MSDDNKVVQFPSHKVRKPGTHEDTEVAPNPWNRPIVIVVSLVATILGATVINGRIDSPSNDNPSRGLASSLDTTHTRDISEDLLLAKKIARESLREPASRGRHPTSEEKLQFEILNPSYRLKMNNNGGLESIEYVESSGPMKQLRNPKELLLDNEDLLKITFDEVSATPKRTSNAKYKFEVYELKNKGQAEPVAHVHFTYDLNNNFVSMNVESSS